LLRVLSVLRGEELSVAASGAARKSKVSTAIALVVLVAAFVPALTCVVVVALVADFRRHLLDEGDGEPFDVARRPRRSA